ncbi:DegT/DnrJ/EryC1/StrS family aminotransferase [Leifsonia sp. NPDC058230]|uniref:DegT/DnrJ/EryC1/StrS family aminotransferase n=1 Tax=Leifsonia sp. NPDC058230 TaxID=3346391 RepID=UPI0036DF2327
MTIPLVDLRAQQAEIAEDIAGPLSEAYANGHFIGGPEVEEFEREYASFIGARHCIGVGNGTDALEFALRAVGVGHGDEVIVPANTFIATAEAVMRIGATPVLVDVDDEYLLIDPELAVAAITERTRAVVPVHLFGQVAPVEKLAAAAEAGLAVVEDAAQAHGARRFGQAAGTLGAVAGTSFYPGKNLGAAGDAGAVTTNDDDTAAKLRLLGAHGSRTKYVHEAVGFNSRLDTVQAIVLRAKLRRLAAWNRMRVAAAQRYSELLAGSAVATPRSAPGNEDVWHLYVVRVEERDRVLARLNEAGIGAGIHYPTPLHLTEALSGLGRGRGDFPVSERAADQILSLPIYPHLTAEQQDVVVEVLLDAVG